METTHEGPHESKPTFYQAYLNSPGWRAVRNAALHRAGFKCYTCGGRRDLQVHHLTYERLGAERNSDLQVLCANCHEGQHIRDTEQSEAGIYIRLASEALKAEPYATISDLADATKTLCAKYKIRYSGPDVNRALEFITGSRIKRAEVRLPLGVERKPDPEVIGPQEAHEWCARLGLGALLSGIIKSMPSVEKTPAEQAAHEANLVTQVAEFRRHASAGQSKRRSIDERLEEIFSK